MSCFSFCVSPYFQFSSFYASCSLFNSYHAFFYHFLFHLLLHFIYFFLLSLFHSCCFLLWFKFVLVIILQLGLVLFILFLFPSSVSSISSYSIFFLNLKVKSPLYISFPPFLPSYLLLVLTLPLPSFLLLYSQFLPFHSIFSSSLYFFIFCSRISP